MEHLAPREGNDDLPAADAATARILASLAADGPVLSIPVRSLLPADSPRLAGLRIDHVHALADAVADLPPILVHRPTMRVVDGMHRLKAAQLQGRRTVAVQFFDGPDDLVFVAAVQANIAHGLPLSLADRQAAARRIIDGHEHWSDRTIAAISGIAPSTVAVIRRERPDRPALVRLGRDGRIRPLSTAEGRRAASEILTQRADASLREVARATGISTGTVRDVRRRMALGEDPVLPRRLSGGVRSQPADGSGGGKAVRRTVYRERIRDGVVILQNLRRDPSLRFTQSGRDVLRWLSVRSVGPEGWEKTLDALPSHCRYLVAELAEWCSERWLDVAARLRDQAASENEE